jgi:GH25 family lysozyme M1 (1,4-beta-N-acetylmuramidase)
MTDTRFCDISEHQPNVDQRAYYNAGYRVFVYRAHSGYRPDLTMPARREATRKVPFSAVGIYAYVVKDRDPAQQAREFVAAIGKLQPNEFPICDYEEIAPGSQVNRVEAWLRVVDAWAGFQASLYSGDYFFRAYLNGTSSWGRRPTWIASYGDIEPSQPHTWWQNTDTASFPGIGRAVDGNIFHGSATDFATRVLGGRRSVPVAPVPKPEQGLASVVKPSGAIETFVETDSGEVYHRWQKGENSGDWGDKWSSLGTPGKS